jgi:hypothetical protein
MHSRSLNVVGSEENIILSGKLVKESINNGTISHTYVHINNSRSFAAQAPHTNPLRISEDIGEWVKQRVNAPF